MSEELDLSRLAELQELLGTDLAGIVATLLAELDTAMTDIETGLAAGDLRQVAQAAHSARNSGVMIDAQPLLDALALLEAGARTGELAATRSAHGRLQTAWAPLRVRLAGAGRAD